MKTDLAKEILSGLGLPASYVTGAVADLDLMARYKYDHYEMYVPASRFFEYLYVWLKQFKTRAQRITAIEFLLRHLIFVSQREMQDLARFLYYDVIVQDILTEIIQREELKPFEYAKAFKRHFHSYLRRCIFIGLSDGAQINFFRRHNIELSQEQVIPYYRTPHKEYLTALKKATRDPKAKFWGVYLIDDFTGSAYTLIHEEKSKRSDKRKLVGTLQRVYQYHKEIIDQADLVRLCHYISTEHAQKTIQRRARKIQAYKDKFKTAAVLMIPESVRITPGMSGNGVEAKVSRMCERYYSREFESENTKKGGGIKFGFGKRGLPLVLFSNTPNNSIFLLWLNRSGPDTPAFNPIFRRIDRHRTK